VLSSAPSRSMSAVIDPPEQTQLTSGRAPAAAGVASAVDRVETATLYLLFALLASFIWKNPMRIGWDAAGYMQAGDEILRGRVPFADIVDVNPPLVQFLHVAPALLARAVKVAPLSFNLFTLATAVVSSVVADWLLCRPPLAVTPARRFATIFTFAFANHIAWVGGHFGQREHFIVLAMFPALLLRWIRHEGHPVPRVGAIAIGVAAATAVAIKPHYVLAILLFEAVYLYRHRDWSRLIGAELLGFLVVAILYAALFVVYPSMRSEYFGRYLPLFASGYHVYDCSIRDLFVPTELWVALAAALWTLARPAAPVDSRLARPLGAFLAGSILVYLVQHKGWTYQILPAFALAPVAAVQTATLARRAVVPLALAALVLTVKWHAQNTGKPAPLEYRFGGLRRAVQSMTRPGEAAIILSTGALGPYPMQLQFGVRPGSRFAWVPLLAMFYPQGTDYGCTYRKWGEGLPAERQLLEDIATDIRVRRPVLIAAEAENAQAMRLGCTPSGWLRESGLLERAMGEYVPSPEVPGFLIWALRDPPIRVDASKRPHEE
jgi:hypothetical protein